MWWPSAFILPFVPAADADVDDVCGGGDGCVVGVLLREGVLLWEEGEWCGEEDEVEGGYCCVSWCDDDDGDRGGCGGRSFTGALLGALGLGSEADTFLILVELKIEDMPDCILGMSVTECRRREEEGGAVGVVLVETEPAGAGRGEEEEEEEGVIEE